MKCLYYLVLLSVAVSCSTSDKKKEEEGSTENGIVKNYRADGVTLFSEVSYEHGKLNGVSKTYHPDGKLFLEEWYVNDKRQGKVTQYYQSGIIHSETLYDSGKIHGIVKRYHKDGKLKAEAPYKQGCACLGLKEYILNGDPRPHYPEIVIKTEDKMLSQASYYVHLSLTERVKKVEFFKGYLKDGCLPDDLERIPSGGDDKKARIGYGVGPGDFVMEKINIVAKIETIAGNILVTQQSYTVSVDFPSL
jgi:hypothetical protein